MSAGILVFIIIGIIIWIYGNTAWNKVGDEYEFRIFIAVLMDLALIIFGLYKLFEYLFTIKLW